MNIPYLEKKAAEVRQALVETVAKAGKGHIGGALSCADILTLLYYGEVLRFKPENPAWDDRDRFILSKGHVAMVLYVILADLGFFPKAELGRVNRGGRLGEHPDRGIPGIEIDSGSLGHGLGIGTGLALAAKLNTRNYLTVVLLGDGECYEGSSWEAAMLAAHHQLNRLIAIVDRNRQCVTDFTENINKLEPLAEKWRAFGWEVREVDGHSFQELAAASKDWRARADPRPLVIIAETVKGKGISFMERQIAWHHGGVSGEKLEKARRELGPER